MRVLSAFIVAIVICNGCRDIPSQKQIYQINTSHVSIKIDTLELDIKGRIESIVKYAGNYYFLSAKYNYRANDEPYIVITDSNFNIIHQSIAPEHFTHNVKLHVQNDSIIAINEFYKTMLLFNQNNFKWELVKPFTFPIYEDKDYRVTTSVSGEFGGTVFFRDKATGLRYEGWTNYTTIVNKMNGKYYITYFMPHGNGASAVIEIPNPRKMLLSDTNRNEQSYNMNETNSRQGMNTLFYWDNPVPVASFIHKNKLLHMCFYQNSTCFTEFRDNKLHKILALGIHIYPELQQQIANKYQLYRFFTVNSFELFGSDYEHNTTNTEEQYGFIEVVPNEIYIHFIKTN
ncbi:hypothetical protein [Butyricimonas sp. Marseille-P3923]|uniref:hypothetical protein n=1 Tax=Butyricimonas sp. Marseille-P3923 TaxID=1987504 RepID=UPI000C0798CC|nr:hypothetical protein [Butyricimonas sp. Marseille-P3923]